MQRESTDKLADLLADVATAAPPCIGGNERERLKAILIDSFAAALAALRHPAALAARRYASAFVSRDAPCTLWGTSRRVNAETAALANGVLLRCHDYNDLYLGQRSWGHPSDIIAAALAVAERERSSGAALLDALAVGYEVTLALFDVLPAADAGWDYCNLTAIGAVCAVSRLLGLSEQQAREALGIAVISHVATDEIESGDLNRRGDLTMWKRFNAGDAMRQAVYACDLARAGAEGVVRPFEGRLGLLAKLGVSESPLGALQARLGHGIRLDRIGDVVLKRWPVGSRAQPAIAASLDLRAEIRDPGTVVSVKVATTDAVFDHLVRSRPEPWAPISRETADHSLPYIVASALLDGRIGTDSFSPERVREPARRAFLRKVQVTGGLPAAGTDAFATRIDVVLADGRTFSAPRAGSPAVAALDRQAIERKLIDGSAGRIAPAAADAILDRIAALESCPDLRELCGLLRVESEAALDGPPEL